MRLFAKIFLCATVVVSAALLFSGYLLITHSHESAMNREVERATNQYQYDRFTVQASLISHAEMVDEGIPKNAWEEFSSDISGLTAFIAEDGTLLYSNLPKEEGFVRKPTVGDAIVHQFWPVDGKTYVVVCGKLVQSGMALYIAVATDVSAVVAQKDQMVRIFSRVYFVTLLLGMVMVILFSTFLTAPIKKMNRAAAQIAQGRYGERLSVSNNDEIGELSGNFNRMADAVEEKVNELSESVRQKEDFVANFAHELKTPLTSVIGYADMLYQKDLSAEQVKDAAWYILSEGLRLESLSLKLMDLIVLDKQDFAMEEMRADELVASIVGGLKPVWEEKGVSFCMEVYPAYVLVEYDLFKTLLLNLIDNALKAECSEISIIGQSKGDKYDISVSDNGRGIPTEELSRITEAFYMVDKSRSRKQHGVGLGLSLAAKIAEVHGCSLSFHSGEGDGTTVTMDLPQGKGDD